MRPLLLLFIALSLTAALTPAASALQESDLTSTPPSCKGKIKHPRDNRGEIITDPHWIDINGDGGCDIISGGKKISTGVIKNPDSYYLQKNGYFAYHGVFPMVDEGILAIYYVKLKRKPYLVTQDTGRNNIPGTSILHWNSTKNNFDWIGASNENPIALTVLKFHVNYLINRSKIAINKHNDEAVSLYDDLVGYIVDTLRFNDAPKAVQNYFQQKQELLGDLIRDANLKGYIQ